MKITNKDVIQSYLITSAKYSFTATEKRILYRVVEIAQKDIAGKKLDANYEISTTLFDDKLIKIPVKDLLLNKKGNNHSEVKKALTSLRNKTIEYETDAFWKLIGIIEKPKYEKYEMTATFEIQPEIWQAILNFTKGFSKYELEVAMSFQSVYAMRFFELFSNNKKPQTLRIDTLKERFGITDKYKNRPADFIKNVIDIAKKELDEKSAYSFNYTAIKEGRKIALITFVPTYIKENVNDEKTKNDLQKQASLRFQFSKDFIKYLNDLGFTNQGVKNNLALFKTFNKKADLYGFLTTIRRNSQEAKNPQGYIIAAMKTYLNKAEHTVKVDEKERNKMTEILTNLSGKFQS
jgi:plasmid replication initiation protein